MRRNQVYVCLLCGDKKTMTITSFWGEHEYDSPQFPETVPCGLRGCVGQPIKVGGS